LCHVAWCSSAVSLCHVAWCSSAVPVPVSRRGPVGGSYAERLSPLLY
jgi:hypothetical protein